MPVLGYTRDTSTCYPQPLWQITATKGPTKFVYGHSSQTGRCRRTGRILCRSRGSRYAQNKFVNTANAASALTPPALITCFFYAHSYRQPRLFALISGSMGH